MKNQAIPMNLRFFGEEAASDGSQTVTEGAAATGQADPAAGVDGKGSDAGIPADPATPAPLTAEAVQELIITALANHTQAAEDAKTEAEKLAKMSKEEQEAYQFQKDKDAIAAERAEIAQAQLRIEAHSILAEKGLPPTLLDNLNYKDAETCKKSIDAIETVIRQTAEGIVNERLKGTVPKAPVTPPGMDKAQISGIFGNV